MISLKKRLTRIVVLLPFFETAYIKQIPQLSFVFDLLKVLSIIIIVIFLIKTKYKITKMDACFLGIFISEFLATFMHDGPLLFTFINTGYIIFLSIFITLVLRQKYEKEVIEDIIRILTIMILICGFLMFSQEISHSTIYFLGNKNQIVPYIITYFFMISIQKIVGGDLNYLKKLVCVLCIVLVVLTKSANGMVAISLIGVIELLSRLNTHVKLSDKCLNIFTYYFIFVIAQISIIYLGLQRKIEWLLVTVLNKDLEFNNRVSIWNRAIKYFMESPIFGIGLENPPYRFLTHNEAHNIVLDYAFKGGIIAIILFMIMLVLIGNNLRKNKTNNLNFSVSLYLMLFLVINFAESFIDNYVCMLILIFSYNIDYFNSSQIKYNVNSGSIFKIKI